MLEFKKTTGEKKDAMDSIYLNYVFDNIITKKADELLPWDKSIPNNLKTYK